MSALNIVNRTTDDASLFERARSSPDSLILVRGPRFVNADEPVSLDLSIGEVWYDQTAQNAPYFMPADGYSLEPRKYVVFTTEQHLRLPDNIFGIVTGRGRLMFQGLLISPGKIDPSYDGNLRIAMYNASQSAVPLKAGDRLCSCSFFEIDQLSPAHRSAPAPMPGVKPLRLRTRAVAVLRANFVVTVTLLIAAASLVVSILSLQQRH